MSRRLPLPILLAGAWLVSIVAGFVAGQRSTRNPAREPATATATAAGSARSIRPGRAEAAAAPRTRAPTRVPGTVASSPEQLDKVLAEIDRNDRIRHFLDYIARLSNDGFPLVAAELATGPMAELRRSEYAMLLTEWAARDPYGAAEYLQANARDDWERETLLAAWAARDPQAAFDWATKAPDAGEINNWVAGAMRGIAAADPDLARRLLEAMEPGRTREQALRNSASTIAARGPDAASGWLGQIADADFRREAARSLAYPLARYDAVAAGSWVAAMNDVGARRDASEVVSEQWARNDLDAARQWVESLPENTRTEAAEGVADQLGRVDPQRGAEWLRSLGTNPDLDGARQRFIDSAGHTAPATAASVVATLSNEQARTGYYNRIVGHWSHQDANAARTWVGENAATLPQSLVERILR